MRAKFIYEKFTDESDPIKDMGIGMLHRIEEWIKTLKMWYPPAITNIDAVLELCIQYGSGNKALTNEFINFLINAYDNYDKDEALKSCIYYNRENFIDTLINKGAKFHDLVDKAIYFKYKGDPCIIYAGRKIDNCL